jgi:hypothetical protein
VFNDRWEVIALHHSGVPRTNPQGEFLDRDGNVWRKGDDPSRLDWVANEGRAAAEAHARLPSEQRCRAHWRSSG